jgi:hypothetical protein
MNPRCPCRPYHQESTSHEVGMDPLNVQTPDPPRERWVFDVIAYARPDFPCFPAWHSKEVKSPPLSRPYLMI